MFLLISGGADERNELCPSMYSVHSSPEEKNQLLYTLTRYGIETTVDRSRKKARIREWIQSSAITEENEDEESAMEDLLPDISNTVNENDTDENGSMQRRHFPERRPSIKKSVSPERPITFEKVKVTSPVELQRTFKIRAPSLRNIERRNPFAPQVAEEMQTMARFANFPNGDPNLAVSPLVIVRPENSGHQSSAPKAPYSAPIPAKVGFNEPIQDKTVDSASKEVKSNNDANLAMNSAWEEVQSKELNVEMIPYMQSPPKSPQVPMRKNRDHGIQSSLINQVPTMDLANNGRNESSVSNKLAHQSPLIPNPLTMSVASQLVMQSFHTIQGINSMQSTPLSGSGTSSSGSVYGKDAYEHYGVAQGTVMTKHEHRNGRSSGSGSRSVSN